MSYFDNDVYYYFYTVEVLWSEDDTSTNIYSGIVLAYSMEDAVKKLENYYDTIVTIKNLKAVMSGAVFEFNLVNNSDNFDFVITQKE